uniref:NACHT LRR and PYD domain-containing protein n=1 Tax=Periophthalmus magnuspinnatus TaxID=409849 RepID=A0A3B4BDT5_9GOBI
MDEFKTVNKIIINPRINILSINIFHCLTEMNDQSVHQQIQDFLKTKGAEKRRLSEIQCSALAYMLQMSEQVLEELDLNNYNTSREGRWRLIPMPSLFLHGVLFCVKAANPVVETSTNILSECELTETHCEVVASALEFNLSKLKELDLSKNYFLNDSGVNCLLTGLQSAYCALEALLLHINTFNSAFRIKDCMLTWCSCYLLASALWFNPFHLKELDLSDNFLRDLGMEHLSSLLQNPDFRLQILRLRCCSFSALGCSDLSSALQSNPSHLRELDLSYNELQDSAVEVLCHFLHNPLCALQILRLSRCSLTESSCSALASALRLNPSHLRVLDLSKNPELKDPGVEHLCDFLQNPLCELEILRSATAPHKYFSPLSLFLVSGLAYCRFTVRLSDNCQMHIGNYGLHR